MRSEGWRKRLAARCASQDGDRICAHFQRVHKVESAELLERISQEGVPADVWAGGNLENELEHGNRRNTGKYGREELRKAAMDVALGRTIAFLVTQAQGTIG